MEKRPPPIKKEVPRRFRLGDGFGENRVTSSRWGQSYAFFLNLASF